MTKNLIVLMGPIGAGKTTLAKKLVKMNDSALRISQDEMGRAGSKEAFWLALETDVENIIIDRMGFNREQRMRWIDPARKAGYKVTIVELKVAYETCFKRVVARHDHPNIPQGDEALAKKILKMYSGEYQAPREDEYDDYYVVEKQ